MVEREGAGAVGQEEVDDLCVCVCLFWLVCFVLCVCACVFLGVGVWGLCTSKI